MSGASRPGLVAEPDLPAAEDAGPDIAVSVVIPAFDAAATIEETVASALGQTLSSIEVIVVDDGSRDETAAIIRRLALSDPRLRLVRSDNRGVGHARNLGIQNARGRFVAPLDADDIWHPSKLERQLALFRARPELGLVYCHCDRIDLAGWVMHPMPAYATDGFALLQHAFVNFISNGSAIMVPRKIALELGGYATALRALGAEGCEDYLLQLRIMARQPIACVPEALVGYRAHEGNMSADRLRMGKSECIVLRLVLAGLSEDLALARDHAYFKADVFVLYHALRQSDWRVAAAAWRAIVARQHLLPSLARLSRLASGLVLERLARAPSAIRRRLAKETPLHFRDPGRRLTGGGLSPRLRQGLAAFAAMDIERGALLPADAEQLPGPDPLLDRLLDLRAADMRRLGALFSSRPLPDLADPSSS
jgi:glycosyltransferase involved in cell wall biosynthesis